MNLKRAIMFGMDARIALIIFASLTMMAGATLQSAIQYSKAQSILSLIYDVEKGIQSYMLDLKQDVPHGSGFLLNVDLDFLLHNVNSLNTWNGPYVDFLEYWDSNHSYGRAKALNGTVDWGVYKFRKDPNTTNTEAGGIYHNTVTQPYEDGNDCIGDDCYYWICIRQLENYTREDEGDKRNSKHTIALAKKIDSIVDDGDGFISGRVRLQFTWNGVHLFYRTNLKTIEPWT